MSVRTAETRAPHWAGDWGWGFLALLGLGLIAWRFWEGLGAVSHLSDGRPWGLWISLDVYCGVALAAGGSGLTAVVYIFRLRRYYALARSAVMSAMIGYMLVVLAVAVDTGQPWRLWHILVYWNPHSPLFEVGWCVMLYTSVLILDFSPDILARFNRRAPLRLIRAVEIPLSVLGIALATMHQSSLGTALLLAPHKLHPLWYTPFLPLLFLLSAVPLGIAAVIAESAWQGGKRGGGGDMEALGGLARALPWMLGLYLLLRLGAMAWEGKLGLVLSAGTLSALFWAEIILGVLLPIWLFVNPRVRASRGALLGTALLLIAGMMLNRINASLLALAAVPRISYLPSLEEWLISLGIIALGVLGYRALDRLRIGTH